MKLQVPKKIVKFALLQLALSTCLLQHSHASSPATIRFGARCNIVTNFDTGIGQETIKLGSRYNRFYLDFSLSIDEDGLNLKNGHSMTLHRGFWNAAYHDYDDEFWARIGYTPARVKPDPEVIRMAEGTYANKFLYKANIHHPDGHWVKPAIEAAKSIIYPGGYILSRRVYISDSKLVVIENYSNSNKNINYESWLHCSLLARINIESIYKLTGVKQISQTNLSSDVPF